jgi:hypothetical protein
MSHSFLQKQDDVVSPFNGSHTDKEIAAWKAQQETPTTATNSAPIQTAEPATTLASNSDSSESDANTATTSNTEQ